MDILIIIGAMTYIHIKRKTRRNRMNGFTSMDVVKVHVANSRDTVKEVDVNLTAIFWYFRVHGGKWLSEKIL